LGSISVRRLYLLLSRQRGLHALLFANPALNSDLMIAQCTAIARKNKQRCAPPCVATVPRSNGQA
jgi:histidine ammonia-lyase